MSTVQAFRTKQVSPDEVGLHQVRVVADYELLSMNDAETEPLDGEGWTTEKLLEAKRAGFIQDFKVTCVTGGGPFGLQFVQFYVDVMQEVEHVEHAKLLGETLLSDYIFHDKVEVRWASVVDEV